jgi:sulfate adenylyltransferase subunit 2
MERFFSPRDKEFNWHFIRPKTKEELKEGDAPFVSLQDTEMSGWGLFESDFGPDCSHVRIHPILSWSELDVWRYIKKENIPINPLYYAKGNKRYRSLGCIPCTDPIDSNASTIEEIVEELKNTTERERAGRSQDKEQIMRRLRSMGYM